MYAPECEPEFPIVLRPHEAVSTILVIDALDDRRSSRTFTSPLSVTAVVGDSARGDGGAGAGGAASDAHPRRRTPPFTVVAGSEVTWTSSRAPVEPSDAFRVDLSILEGDDGSSGSSEASPRGIRVGSVFRVQLEISNLSSDARDVVVQVEGHSAATKDDSRAAATAVSEKDGRKFSVGGLAVPSENDPDRREAHGSSSGLLMVDGAIRVGEIKGSATTVARLRLVPLRSGTLRVPNLELLDRRRGNKRYDAPHNLRVFVHPSD
jgi:hypothetical protein